MSRLRRRLRVLMAVLALLGGSGAVADERAAVFGRWASEGSIIEITSDANQLSARVMALDAPTFEAGEEGVPIGEPRVDVHNPDPALRGRPVLGLELLSGYTFTGKRWEGKIYDPESGNTYSSRMHVDKQGNLAMRGYVGVPMLGRTATFEPLGRCTPAMQVML